MKIPRHPLALKYLHLYRGNSFPEISQRIGKLEEEYDRGKAFEVWVLGYLATQRSNDIVPGTLWLSKRPTFEVINRLNLHPDGDDYGIDGGWINRQFGTDDVCQAKFKRDRDKLNWGADNLSRFFGSADSPHINAKYVISNSYEVDDYTKTRPGYTSILGDELDKLSSEELHQIAAWLEGEEIILETPKPRADQLEAIDRINQYLQVDDCTKCIMACATGKTFVSLLLYESRLPATTLVLVPSLNLLRQRALKNGVASRIRIIPSLSRSVSALTQALILKTTKFSSLARTVLSRLRLALGKYVDFWIARWTALGSFSVPINPVA